MAPDKRRGGPESGNNEFDGRDLLVGRPGGAEGRSAAGAAGTAQTAASPQPGAHDDAIREILETVRATAARIDALQEAPGPEHETAEALARERAALTQAVDDARGTLAEAAEIAAQQDGQTSAGAQALAESAAALKTQGAALDKRLRATGKQTEAAAQSIAGMKEAAAALDDRLRTHAEEVLRAARRQRWRPWLTGLAIGSASFLFFIVGAVLQRETDVVSFGDPRYEWNDYVVEHFAPLLGICASKARLEDRLIPCRLEIEPSLDVTVPFYPGGTVKVETSEGEFDPTVDQ
ncbi:MAG: hypothetical protein OXO52_02115 [Rhodospirillales bacterium]|nr:hypothetical protein [Rhodospirillales bacterium]MDE0377883.1 hypothetical protein [Rhodospirillales bacterium]